MKYDFYISGTIGEEFDWWTGQRGTTAEMVKDFLSKNKNKEVTIAVSSPGGYLNEGMTMAELIAEHGQCNMVIIGMTASAATILCMKAKSVKIARGSLVLIHNSSQYIFSGGQSNKQKIDAYIEKLKATRQDLDTFDKAIADFYSFRNHKTIEENMAQMDKEQWMSAQEAVDFGIVDAILDDDESKKNAKAVQNFLASYNGIEEHFQLPSFPEFEKPEEKIPQGIMARIREFLNGFSQDSPSKNPVMATNSETNDGAVQTSSDGTAPPSRPEQKDSSNSEIVKSSNGEIVKSSNSLTQKNTTKMIFNLICNLLGIQDIAIADGAATISEEQLNTIEAALAQRDKQITDLTKEKDDLQKEKDDLQKAKDDLQKEFDDYKEEAGDDSAQHAKSEEDPMSSAELYDQVKGLL